MNVKLLVFLISGIFLNSCFAQVSDEEKYEIYKSALKRQGSTQCFIVIKLLSSDSDGLKEYCLKANQLVTLLTTEYDLKRSRKGANRARKIALQSKERIFQFKNNTVLTYLNQLPMYTEQELLDLQEEEMFRLALVDIKSKRSWSSDFSDLRFLRMYAHAFFNLGILSGENNCRGGSLHFVERVD